MASIAEINVRIGARIDEMVKGLNKAERRLQRSGRKLKQLGGDLTTAVSLPLAGIAAIGVKMAVDLESSFSKVENLVGITGTALDKFKDGVKDVSGEVGKTQGELAEALFTITSAGEKGGAALDVLRSSAKASVIGLGETKDVAKATTAIMQAYKDTNITAAESVNLLAKTVKAGNLEASELAPSIGKVLPLAAQMGISFEEVGANIATFTRLGISASEATNSLKAVLSNLIKPGKQAQEALAKYGLSAEGVRDSIKKNGLAATLQDLIKKFDGNTTALGHVFGSVEGFANVLGTAGAQGKEYTEILKSMSDGVDIVEQGFEKASETANQKFQKSLVKLQNISITIGNVLLPILTEMADGVASIAGKFSELESGTQKTIIKTLAFVAALGPMIKLLGILKTTYAGIKSAQAVFATNLKSLSGAILGAANKFKKMDAIMKATVIGAVVAVTAAAVAIFQKWNNTLTDSQKIQNTLTDVNTKAAQSIVEEKIEVESLTAILKNENSTREEKRQALKKLNQISPQYFGGLDLEKTKIEDVTKAQDDYIANLLKMAKVQAAKERIVELNKELLDTDGILDKTEPGFDNFQAGVVRMTDFSGSRTEKLAKIWGDAANDYKSSLQNQIDELVKFAAAEESILTKRATNADIKPFSPIAKKSTPDKKEKTERAKIEIIDLDSINEQRKAQNDLYTDLVNNLTNTEIFQKRLREEQELSKISQDELLNGIASSPEHFEMMRLSLESLRVEMAELEAQEKRFNAMMEAAKAAGEAIQSYAKQGGDSLKELGKVALKSAADFVRSEMMKAVAAFISRTIAISGPLGVILAGAGAAVVGTLFNKAIGSLSVPALAEGGLATAPTLAMVGDNRNASVDPEVIAPLSKLKNMLGGMGSNNVNVTGTFRVAGQDLLLVLDNATRDRMRTAGY